MDRTCTGKVRLCRVCRCLRRLAAVAPPAGVDCGATAAGNVTVTGAGSATDDAATDGAAVSTETEEAEKTTRGTGDDRRRGAYCLSATGFPSLPLLLSGMLMAVDCGTATDTRSRAGSTACRHSHSRFCDR